MNKYTLLGDGISYSLSPEIHNYLNRVENCNLKYDVTNSSHVDGEIITQFSGGNVTIPHKNTFYEYALEYGEVDEIANRDKSVNTFKIVDGKMFTTSTDQLGIVDSIVKLNIFDIENKNHIIFGDGATSNMLVSTLQSEFSIQKKNIVVISRKTFGQRNGIKYTSKSYLEHLSDEYVLYNTTPLGTNNLANVSPFTEEQVKNANAVFDTSYTPIYNLLAKQCFKYQVRYISGLNMLIVQALESFEFWTGRNVKKQYNNVKRELMYAKANKLIVCAMPFAGKTTMQKRLRDQSIDLDFEVAKFTGYSNADYINKFGLEKFREQEVEVLKRARSGNKKVIFLGGGTFTNPSATDLLTNELVVYMYVHYNELLQRFDLSRANIQSKEQLCNLYRERNPHYKNIANFTISARNIGRFINEYLDN